MQKSSKDPVSDLMTRVPVERLQAKALCSDGAPFLSRYIGHACPIRIASQPRRRHLAQTKSRPCYRVGSHVLQKSSKDPVSDLMTLVSIERLRARELCSDGASFLDKYWSRLPCLSHDGHNWHSPSVSPDSESVATFAKIEQRPCF